MERITRRAVMLTMSLGFLTGSCRRAPSSATVTLTITGMV